MILHHHRRKILQRAWQKKGAKGWRPTLSATLLSLLLPAQALAQQADTVKVQELQEVVVSAHGPQQRISSVVIGAEQLQLKELNSAPQLFGERDVVRSLQLLPGVKMESEGSSSFQVRGGTAVQNSILYDEAPVYNVGHLAGLFSAFNEGALAGATLYKGLVPAQHGGATSAVLDITGRTARTDRWHAEGSIGLLTARGQVEGPLVSDRIGLVLSARRSYADLFLKLSDKYRDNSLYFYDANMKMDWRLGHRDRLFLSVFTSHDKMGLADLADMQWTNVAGSLSWSHQLHGQSNSQTTMFASSYGTDNGVDMLGFSLTYRGHIRHTGLRQDFNLRWKRHELTTGMQTMLTDVMSAEWIRMGDHEKERRKAWDNSAWANWQWRLMPQLTLTAGMRLSAFTALGGPYYYDVDDKGNITWLHQRKTNRPVKTHVTVEPRIGLALQPGKLWSIKAGYSRLSQNVHALRSQNSSTPFDRYAISSNLLKPEVSDQVSLGLFYMLEQRDYDFSLEGYYRHTQNVLDYRDGVDFASAIEIERLVLPGEGRGYGAELCIHKNTGRLTGWIGYTLSWSKTRIDGISGGQWYNASNDRRHDINIVAAYRLSPRWTLNATWTYYSGQAYTAPSGKYQLIDNYIYYYTERNGYRAPDYHRLDVGATWSKPIASGRLTREWSFGIYNLYNRYNPYLIRFEDGQYGRGTKATMVSLLGIVPSVSFNLKY